MKREDVKNKIPGITEEQLNWLMSENGNDINRDKFDGKKTPEEYEAEITKLQNDMKAQADDFEFDIALNTAIFGKKGRSVKAIRALLDLDALKSSTDRQTDIAKALDDVANENPWAFDEAKNSGYPDVKIGGDPTHRPSAPDGVMDAFAKLNPNLKI